jgi:hypothetical protein
MSNDQVATNLERMPATAAEEDKELGSTAR